jgi:hypothetical protein
MNYEQDCLMFFWFLLVFLLFNELFLLLSMIGHIRHSKLHLATYYLGELNGEHLLAY